MDLSKHELLFSKTRLRRYVTACKGDVYKGLKLYKYNIQASQALYPVLSVLEVALRNSIDREVSTYYKDSNWLITQKHDFAENRLLVYKDKSGKEMPDNFFIEKLEKAERKLSVRGIRVSHAKLLAELTFGFWVKFFDTCPIKILKGVPLQAFTNRPHVKLAKVHSHLNAIVTLRNRISHSEPICFNRESKLCITTMKQYQFDIEDALYWIDSDLSKWTQRLNFYKPVITRIKELV